MAWSWISIDRAAPRNLRTITYRSLVLLPSGRRRSARAGVVEDRPRTGRLTLPGQDVVEHQVSATGDGDVRGVHTPGAHSSPMPLLGAVCVRPGVGGAVQLTTRTRRGCGASRRTATTGRGRATIRRCARRPVAHRPGHPSNARSMPPAPRVTGGDVVEGFARVQHRTVLLTVPAVHLVAGVAHHHRRPEAGPDRGAEQVHAQRRRLQRTERLVAGIGTAGSTRTARAGDDRARKACLPFYTIGLRCRPVAGLCSPGERGAIGRAGCQWQNRPMAHPRAGTPALPKI